MKEALEHSNASGGRWDENDQLVRIECGFALPRVLKVFAVAAIILLAGGIAIGPLESEAWKASALKEPQITLDNIGKAAGQGAVLGVLGGMRSLVADMLWIRMHDMWADRDYAGTEAAIQMVVSTDPRHQFFWSQGSRILALDMAMWRVKEMGGYNIVAESERAEVFRQFGEMGIRLLNEGLEHHPASIKLLEDKAHIYVARLGDPGAASDVYKDIYYSEGSPYYAPRVYSQLLIDQGRLEEAYAFLIKEYPRIPDVVYSQKPVILERIKMLEEKLKVAPKSRVNYK